jgi:two-component system chemotaxis response regulator CheY
VRAPRDPAAKAGPFEGRAGIALRFDRPGHDWGERSPAKPEQAMKQCLVVDDSAVIRKVARQILEKLGFEVGEAEGGVEALDRCGARMPDVILVDANMPGMRGIDFLERLRASSGGDRPRVVFCTAERDVEHIARAMDAGADDFVMKPLDREILATKFATAGLI